MSRHQIKNPLNSPSRRRMPIAMGPMLPGCGVQRNAGDQWASAEIWGRRWHALGMGVALGLVVATPVQANVDIANVPLFVSRGVAPNIMLMLDNSGSMQNIVPDLPYDPNITYLASCPNQVAAGTQVETRIVSGTPRIRIGGTNFSFGTGSGQRCFVTGADYPAKLFADGPNGGSTTGYLPAQYTGNYLNWFFDSATDPSPCANTWASGRKPCTESRMMVARNAGKTLIDSMSGGMRAGLSTYNGGDGGSLREIIGDLDATKKTAIKGKIDALTASGSTPLAETLADIGRYFAMGYTGNLILHPGQSNQATAGVAQVFNNHSLRNDSGQNITTPVQYSCQKNFAVLLTDGRPQQDREISTYLRDYTGDCAAGQCDATPTTNNLPSGPLTSIAGKNGTKIGRSYESQGSDYLDDVAQALFEVDLRPDLVDPEGEINNVATFLVGFADDQVINDPLMQDTANQGGGEFLIAGNEGELVSAFSKVLDAIVAQVESASTSAAASSATLQTDSLLYTAGFRSSDWSGQLVARAIKPDGTVASLDNAAPAWDAEALLAANGARKLFTRARDTIDSGTQLGGGVPLNVGALSQDQQDALANDTNATTPPDNLAAERLQWLHGDNGAHPDFRVREGLDRNGLNVPRLLGDIVNSNPQFAGKRDFGYRRLSGLTPPYVNFRSTTAYQNRPDVLYVGANDGMLHAFDAKTGEEYFAYLPSELLLPATGTDFARVNQLMDQDYEHRFLMDGTATIGDAHWGSAWKTVLVGTMGAGGRTVFALDVTHPQNFSESKVLWEFTHPDLGYGVDKPTIVRMANGEWAAIFGNGYNSANHKAVLFIVRLSDGQLLARIDTDQASDTAASPNGLATPTVTLTLNDLSAQTVYAGDLKGRMWRFDVSSSNSNQWDDAGKRKLLFQAVDAQNNPQPITAATEVAVNPDNPGALMVLFGTGSYFRNQDDLDTQVQSFYGIEDDGGNSTVTRGDLLQQTILSQDTVTFNGQDFTLREVSDNPLTNNHKGWVLDLFHTTADGERVVSKPVLLSGATRDRVRFTTLIPEQDPCASSDRDGFIMDLSLSSGRVFATPVFDLNGDGLFDAGDMEGGRNFSGVNFGSGEELIVIQKGDGRSSRLYSGDGDSISANEPGTPVGRQSWRQLQ